MILAEVHCLDSGLQRILHRLERELGETLAAEVEALASLHGELVRDRGHGARPVIGQLLINTELGLLAAATYTGLTWPPVFSASSSS